MLTLGNSYFGSDGEITYGGTERLMRVAFISCGGCGGGGVGWLLNSDGSGCIIYID